MKRPRDTQLTCSRCGFQTSLTTRGLAEHRMRWHACEKHLEAAARSERFWARLAEIDRTPKPCHHKQVTHEHGTRTCYTLDGCRCWPCTKARTDADAQIRKDNAYGRTTYVSSETARAHVNALRSAGWGVKKISEAAGVSVSALGKLIWGKNQRPSKRVSRATQERILAVPLPSIRQLGLHQLVPAVGAARRIRALGTLGWSVQALCGRAGIGYQAFYAVATEKYDTCYARTWVAIADLYDELWDQHPPETSKSERVSAAKARRSAERRGWFPPLAWDDDTIDNPATQPQLDGPAGDDERRVFYGQGMSDRQIARELGLTPDSVRLWRTRSGLPPNFQRGGKRVAS